MNDNKRITVFLHLLIWLALFSIPYVLSYGQEQEVNRVFAHFWIPLVFYAAAFYINYFVLIDRFLFQKKTAVFVIINIAVVVVSLFLRDQIEIAFFDDISMTSKNNIPEGPPFKMLVYVQTLSFLAPLLFSIAIKTTQRLTKTEAERKEAANSQLTSELQHLRYQLQPHFFFNSLNNIYSMVDLSPEQAKRSIHSLSKLMRYMLYETNLEMVPLTKEIDFMTKYIELMKLRVSEKTQVVYSFPSEESGVSVAPLLLVSLVENAFKHGVSSSQESHIKMAMNYEKGQLSFRVENSNFPKQADDQSGSGIGLVNLEKRLDLLYSNKFSFRTAMENDCFVAELKIETE